MSDNRISHNFMALIALTLVSFMVQAAGDAQLARNINSLEAYDILKSQQKTYLLDVRTEEEYQLVGHPPLAYNIPFIFFQGGAHRNPHFVEDVAARFSKKDDTLLVICRSGGRSAPAADALKRAGFKHVYNVRDGFEGSSFKGGSPKEEALLQKYSPFYGHRGRVEGWQYYGLPYTYESKEELLYRPFDAQ